MCDPQFGRLDNDRPEEVWPLRERLSLPSLDQPANVLPQRRPLRLFIPHVLALEQEHNQLAVHNYKSFGYTARILVDVHKYG